MTFPSYSDSPGSPTKYLGQSYRFAPVYIRQRDPLNGTDGTPFTSPDIRPKENQGYYPVGSFWINKTLNRLWACTSFGIDANNHTCAHWELIESSGITGVEQFLLPDASVITPSGIPPQVTFQNGAGISITQGADLHTIEITATGAGTETITGDDGTAVSPLLGTILVVGKVVANATHAKAVFTETSGAANQENIDIQVSAAIGATDITKVGLSAFDNTQFAVDANGFVTLIGATTPPILGVHPDTFTGPGTDPVIPDGSGNIKLEGGATFATNTQANPIRTNSLAANTIDLQIQLAGSNAGASTANKFGVSQFDSNQFSVTNGFVQLAGGTTAAIEKVNVQTGTSPIVPAASAITINGALVAAGTNPVRTDGTGANTMAVEVQTAQAIPGTDSTKVGLAAFNNSQFTVDANGFVTFVGTTPLFPWTDEAVNFNASTNNGYFCTAVLTAILPPAPSQGDVVKFVCTSANALTITANAGQTVRIGNVMSSVAGTATSTKIGDSVSLVFRNSDKIWYATDSIGTWGLV